MIGSGSSWKCFSAFWGSHLLLISHLTLEYVVLEASATRLSVAWNFEPRVLMEKVSDVLLQAKKSWEECSVETGPARRPALVSWSSPHSVLEMAKARGRCLGIMNQFSPSCPSHSVRKLAALAQTLITLGSANSPWVSWATWATHQSTLSIRSKIYQVVTCFVF